MNPLSQFNYSSALVTNGNVSDCVYAALTVLNLATISQIKIITWGAGFIKFSNLPFGLKMCLLCLESPPGWTLLPPRLWPGWMDGHRYSEREINETFPLFLFEMGCSVCYIILSLQSCPDLITGGEIEKQKKVVEMIKCRIHTPFLLNIKRVF